MGLNKCSKCKLVKDSFWPNQDWCIPCQKEYHKKRYEENKELWLGKQREYRKTERYKQLHKKDNRLNYVRNTKKCLARKRIYNAVKAGKIIRIPCFCGEMEVQAHHPDHNKPLEIVWLCVPHHWEAEKAKNSYTNLIKKIKEKQEANSRR